jgi:hypothetical protein
MLEPLAPEHRFEPLKTRRKPKALSRSAHGLYRDSDRIVSAWRAGLLDPAEANMLMLAVHHRLDYLKRQELRMFTTSTGHKGAPEVGEEYDGIQDADPLEWDPDREFPDGT